jgi:hypothetical protein
MRGTWIAIACALALLAGGAGRASAQAVEAVATGFEIAPPAEAGAAVLAGAREFSSFATGVVPLAEPDPGLLAARGMGPSPSRHKKTAHADSTAAPDTSRAERNKSSHAHRTTAMALSPERARVMLQSLTFPGWGQATLGQNRAAGVFALIETGIWASFVGFRIQESMRRNTYERTAFLFGGVDLNGRDEEFRRIVGFYMSSDEYNQLVVRRDAANLYYGDPAAYDAYVAAHELRGANAWSWDSEASLERYRLERQRTQRAQQRAHTAIAAAVINRLLSVVHVSRTHADKPAGAVWKIECAPTGEDPTAYRFGVRADF